MATVYITFEIWKDFEDWKVVFDDDQDNLNENGIETLAVGYELDNPSKVRIALSAESLEAVQEFMQGNNETIEDSGHIIETTVFEEFSDWLVHAFRISACSPYWNFDNRHLYSLLAKDKRLKKNLLKRSSL